MENKVKEILEKVRPYIQMHGGDVVFVEIKDNDVVLQVFGACKDCPLSDLTYNKMIGGLLKEEIPEIKKVVII
ncbi:MAG: NifU family protein [Candidatus Wolfebacteria bacterium]|nr:NifU family protein [Candidatus Wolfebacteria bacterium]